MSTPRITEDMVRGEAERAIFRSIWPDGAEATVPTVILADLLALNLGWGTTPILTEEARSEYWERRADMMDQSAAEPPLSFRHRIYPSDVKRAHLWVEAFLKSQGGIE